jgi:enoyl-CoA hydratase/carnithine racemase
MTTHNRLTISKVTPAYWLVTIENPPINLYDPEMFAELNVLMDTMDVDRDLKVVVFESANPDYFVAHYDLERGELIPDQPGAAEFSEWPKFVTRLAQSRVVSVAKIRGRARGHGSELALACDIRFASKEKAVLAQVEVGVAVVPGGGATEWLSALTGRSRALEIICGSDDFDAATAEKYGWVNRAIPDADLDQFVDNFARRV